MPSRLQIAIAACGDMIKYTVDSYASILSSPKNTCGIQKKLVVTWRPVFGQDRKESVCRTASRQKVLQLLVPKDISTHLLERTLLNFTTSITTLPQMISAQKPVISGNSQEVSIPRLFLNQAPSATAFRTLLLCLVS
jgi:hypothetical protein